MRIALLFPVLICAGCATLPALEDRLGPETRQAPYPALIPLDPILQGTEEPQTAEQTDAALKARAAALRARAAQMRAEAAQ